MDFISMLPSIFKGVTGIGQLLGGLFGQAKRPTYEIPKSATDSLNVAKGLASQTKLPGQEIYETQLGEKTANMTKSIERMGGGGAGLGALSNIYAQESGAKRNLAMDAARYYAGNQQQLKSSLGQMAQYEDKKWQKNIGDKYDEEAGASSALIEGGLKNTSTALGDVAGSHFYDKLFNGTGNTGGVGGSGTQGNIPNQAWLQNWMQGIQQGQNNPYFQLLKY